jgi:acyl-CoA thioesterase YciA
MEEKKKSKKKSKANCATRANARCPILKDLLLPKDTNANFDIFGGVLMSRLDIAAALFARGISPLQKWVTVAVNNIIFKKPVQVGDVFSIYAQQKRIGTSSLTITLQGEVERKGEVFEAVSAEYVFVTVNANHESEPIQVQPKPSKCRSCAS